MVRLSVGLEFTLLAIFCSRVVVPYVGPFLKSLSDIKTIWFPFWSGMDPAREGFGTSRFLLARD
jgi:hypothetical protein